MGFYISEEWIALISSLMQYLRGMPCSHGLCGMLFEIQQPEDMRQQTINFLNEHAMSTGDQNGETDKSYRERILRRAKSVKAFYFFLLATISTVSVVGFVLAFLLKM